MSIDLLVRSPDYAAQVAANLPAPTETNYQVPYDNRLELIGAMSMLSTIEPVATIQEIHTQREVDAAIATGELLIPKITVGNCCELLVTDFDMAMLAAIAGGEDIAVLDSPMLRAMVDATLALEDVVYDEMGLDASVEERAAGQFFKPRSSFTETLKDGSNIYSYFGDGINSRDLQHRRPDPRRLIAARIQARDTKELMEHRGRPPIVAHEALSLPYEYMAGYQEQNERYLLSGHRLWIGDRTNDPLGPHVRLLSGVKNPIGVKIGPKSGNDHIARLVEALRLDGPGHLAFMIRVGLDQPAKLLEVAQAIARYAPNQIQQWDVHGDTTQGRHEDGSSVKIRSVERAVASIQATHHALAKAGLPLHGLHIEAKGTNDRPECVDLAGQIPIQENKPIVDPLFTLEQLRAILHASREYLPGAA